MINLGLKYNSFLRHRPGMEMTKWNIGPLFCTQKLQDYNQDGGTLWTSDWELWVIPFLYNFTWNTVANKL